jgi:DNA-binding GntR family transcriptional regulator
MGQNSAIVPEALDAPSMPPPLTVAIRSQVSKIQSLHHDTLSALRDLIVHNELPPGTRLTETVLSERFSVSRTPLREALKVLSSEGLVEILPNRGARVVTLTASPAQIRSDQAIPRNRAPRRKAVQFAQDRSVPFPHLPEVVFAHEGQS